MKSSKTKKSYKLSKKDNKNFEFDTIISTLFYFFCFLALLYVARF